jgi:soluble lytic murein transglycosylase
MREVRRHKRRAAFAPNRLDAITAQSESGNRDYYSNGRPVTSPAGALFGMQVMPETARDPGFGLRPANPENPADMNRLGREYRAAMERRYGGDPAKMWAAYNAGPGRLDAAIRSHGENWLQAMPAETRDYVQNNLRQLRGR